MSEEMTTTGTEEVSKDVAATPAGESTLAPQKDIVTDAPMEVTPGGDVKKPVYSPNLKYKVKDVEKEFPEWSRPLVKDEMIEKNLRDLYTKADGLDVIKQDRDTLSDEVVSLRQERDDTYKTLEMLNYCVKNDDLQTFFDTFKIPKEQVLKFALREIQFSENPQLRQQYEQARQKNLEHYNSQNYNQQFVQQYEQMALSLRAQQLDFALSKPEAREVAEAYDARVGKPGAFREAIIRQGHYHAVVSNGKVDKSAEELIEELKVLYSLSGSQGQQSVAPMQGTDGKSVVGSKGKPVLPSIPGSGQSAVRKSVKSLDDINARREQLLAEQAAHV